MVRCSCLLLKYSFSEANYNKSVPIIDTDTLLYWVEETIMSDGTIIPGTELPPIGDGSGGSGGDNASSSTSAILGQAILGSMLLGTE